MKVGLIQTRGIGDIIIAAPIAKHFSDAGHTVLWPVDSDFFEFVQEAFPYVSFIPVEAQSFPKTSLEYFYLHPLQVLTELGCECIFSLYSYLSGLDIVNEGLARSLKFDEYKYAVAGVPFSNKWELKLNRNLQRETALLTSLGITRPYLVVHDTGSNFNVQINLPEDLVSAFQVVRISQVTSNPFDWLSVLEGATYFIGVDSCFSNLVDQLNLCEHKFLFLRSEIKATPVLKNGWRFVV